MTDVSRLSDQNIVDPILRASYYQSIFQYLKSKDAEVVKYIIKVDEGQRGDLASYRCYATSELSWLFYLVCDVSDQVDGLPIGEELTLPTAAWIRRSMRQFMDEMGL